MAAEGCDLLRMDLPSAEAVRAVLPPVDSTPGGAGAGAGVGGPDAAASGVGGGCCCELCVCDLAWACGLAQNLVSHHVRQLRIAALAVSRRDGRLACTG